MLHRTGTDDDLFNAIQTPDSDGFVFAIAKHSSSSNKKKSAALQLQLLCFVSLSDFFDHLHSFNRMKKSDSSSFCNLFPLARAFNSLQRMPHILCNSFFLFCYFFFYNYSAYSSPIHSRSYCDLFGSSARKNSWTEVKWNLLAFAFWIFLIELKRKKHRLAVKCVWFNPFGLVFFRQKNEGNII